MNFFERQAAARRQSIRLLLLFALAVFCIVGAVCLGFALLGASLKMLVVVAFITLLVIAAGSLYRLNSLRDGGEAIARQLGGSEVPVHTQDFQLQRLRNVVEEIAIASGVPMPRLFVLEREKAINAFAAGYTPSDAAIAVTRGALEKLNRDELQGVIAHEFSHILNGDMRLNIRLIGVLFGILLIGLAGKSLLENLNRLSRGGRSRDNSAELVLITGLLLFAVGYTGVFFGRLIKAGVSRSREMLADASAVQFTRQTTGLAGALKKVAALSVGSQLRETDKAEEVSHMLFGDGLGLSGLFATHPPLLARIQALEPGFAAKDLEALHLQWLKNPPDGLAEDRLSGFSAALPVPPPLPNITTEVAINAQAVAAQVATPTNDDYVAAEQLIHTLPDTLRQRAHDRQSAPALLLGLLLSANTRLAAPQQAEITRRMGEKIAHDASAYQPQLARLHPMLRLPLAALTFPALRQRSCSDLHNLAATCDALVHVDDEVSLFEYALSRMLQAQLNDAIEPWQNRRRLLKLSQTQQQARTLLTLLAQLGHADSDEARRAYNAGISRLYGNEALPYQPGSPTVQILDAVWPSLDRLSPMGKQLLIEAITLTISHDGRVTLEESELLRSVCAILHCPLPPVLH
ncbi:peptidase M48 Ste24p [Lysobacteraceae bacterium NML08-0793]|nr:peptidase M48 Ste24p [Xanthomonadaceae bacterium NML08-0793]